jgi:hypothetical protein
MYEIKKIQLVNTSNDTNVRLVHEWFKEEFTLLEINLSLCDVKVCGDQKAESILVAKAKGRNPYDIIVFKAENPLADINHNRFTTVKHLKEKLDVSSDKNVESFFDDFFKLMKNEDLNLESEKKDWRTSEAAKNSGITQLVPKH